MRYYYYILHKATDINMQGNNYVGKTKNLHSRFNKHRECCNDSTNSLYHLKVYNEIRNNGGFDNWVMTILESKEFNGTKKEISEQTNKKERELKELFGGQLNKNRPYITYTEKKELMRRINNKRYASCEEYRKQHKIKMLNRYYEKKND
jgi:hypothetical protein